MIRIFGDIHAEFWHFNRQLGFVPDDYTVIQVGDFGIWPQFIEPPDGKVVELIRPVYFIDGNHEHFGKLWEDKNGGVREIYPNMIYVPRGTVLELDGRKILFLGGAESVDKAWRTEGVSWFREESITYADVMGIDLNQKIDFMVTHVPPLEIVDIITNGDSPAEWNISSKMVQGVWDALDRPPLYCGHFHENRKMGNVTVLDILQYVDV